MPRSVVKRAEHILKQLEADNASVGVESHKIIGLDINNLTPVEALNKLFEIKKIVTGRS